MARKSDQEALAFIRERLIQIWQQLGSGDADFSKREEACKRMYLELLRGDIPLPPGDSVRLGLADELEHYYFPSAHRERAEQRQFKATIYRGMIERFAKAEGISLAKAKERVAAFYDLEYVAALEQFLRRTENERKKRGDKKLKVFVPYKNFGSL